MAPSSICSQTCALPRFTGPIAYVAAIACVVVTALSVDHEIRGGSRTYRVRALPGLDFCSVVELSRTFGWLKVGKVVYAGPCKGMAKRHSLW
jgi:hypothetical protein